MGSADTAARPPEGRPGESSPERPSSRPEAGANGTLDAGDSGASDFGFSLGADAIQNEWRARAAAEGDADRVRRLLRVASALSSAATGRQVAEVIVEEGRAEIGAEFGGVWLLESTRHQLELLAARGMPPDMEVQAAAYSLAADNPLCAAVRSGEPIWLESWEDFSRRFPGSEQKVRHYQEPRPQAFGCLPLRIGAQVIGGLSFAFVKPRRLSADDRSLVELLAQHCAQGLERARLYERALDAIRVRDDFLSVAGHELRTPLTTLMLQMQILMEDEPAGAPPDRFAPVMRTLRRLITLADDVMDVSRLRAGRLRLEPDLLDLSVLVRDVAGRVADGMRRHRPPLRIQADASVHGHWDPIRLEQVVTNLVTNACKYGGDRPVDIEVGHHADGAQIVVRDQGLGIGPADQARIFERFERAVDPAGYAGLGLGLWIAREVVEAHGGHISVRSEQGQGAEFRVVLPLRPPGTVDAPG